jgi:hypothetical protein
MRVTAPTRRLTGHLRPTEGPTGAQQVCKLSAACKDNVHSSQLKTKRSTAADSTAAAAAGSHSMAPNG